MYMILAKAAQASNDSGALDMSLYTGIIGSIIGWTALICVLVMLRSFFGYIVSMILADYLVRKLERDPNGMESIRKIVKWFGKEEQIIEVLTDIKKKLHNEEDEKEGD